MKKKILSTLLALVSCVVVSTVSVGAITAGYSDYGKSDTKTVASVTTSSVALADTTNGSVIDIPKTALPAGVTQVTFATKAITTDAAEYKTANTVAATQGYSNLTMYDLKLLDQDSTAVSTLSGKVSVTLKVVGDVNTVLYYNDSTNKFENLGGTIKNGFITFETSHFSYYVLAKATAAVTTTAAAVTTTGAATTVAVTNPKTGNDMTTAGLFGLMGIIALGTTVISIKAKKSK